MMIMIMKGNLKTQLKMKVLKKKLTNLKDLPLTVCETDWLQCSSGYIMSVITNMHNLKEPVSYTEAMQTEQVLHWKQAMGSEMKSHLEHHTWTLEGLPVGKIYITCKWL